MPIVYKNEIADKYMSQTELQNLKKWGAGLNSSLNIPLIVYNGGSWNHSDLIYQGGSSNYSIELFRGNTSDTITNKREKVTENITDEIIKNNLMQKENTVGTTGSGFKIIES